MKSVTEFVGSMAFLFNKDINDALARVFDRILGRQLTKDDAPDCMRYDIRSPGSTSMGVAYVYKGRLILLSNGIDIRMAALGKVSWWIKEME